MSNSGLGSFLYNTRPEVVNVQACGNWFEFKPYQIKAFARPEIAHFIATDKSYEGLVPVPESVVNEPNSEETARIKAEARQKGIASRIAYLERVKNNLLVSLQSDLDKSNLKIDVLKLASPGEKAALKELDKLQTMQQEEQNKDLEELKALKEKLGGNT